EVAVGAAEWPGREAHAGGRQRGVAPDAGRVDVEPEPRALVVKAVKTDAEPVGGGEWHVAPAQPARDRGAVRHPRRNVDRLVVVGDPGLRAFTGRRPIHRIALGERVDD